MKEMKRVYICQTYDERHNRDIVCIKDNIEGAREWLHTRTRLIRQMNRLLAKYTLARIRSKEASKLYSRYYKFREEYKLYHDEQTCHPFFWTMDLQK